MMKTRGRWIIDASVALKWYLRDELYITQADALYKTFSVGEAEFLAPSFIRYELANALLIASKRGRISFDTAREQLQDFLALAIHQAEDDNGLVNSAVELASSFDIAVYDALYLALARQSGNSFVTADGQLYAKVRDTFSHAIWIEDIQV